MKFSVVLMLVLASLARPAFAVGPLIVTLLRQEPGNMPANTTNTVVARVRMNNDLAVMAAVR